MKINYNHDFKSFEVSELTNTAEIVYENKDLMNQEGSTEKELLLATADAVYEICNALSEQTENQYRKQDLRDAAEYLNDRMFDFRKELYEGDE